MTKYVLNTRASASARVFEASVGGDYRSGNNLVLLKPDVAGAFPTEEAVNAALRSLVEAEQRSMDPKKNSDG